MGSKEISRDLERSQGISRDLKRSQEISQGISSQGISRDLKESQDVSGAPIRSRGILNMTPSVKCPNCEDLQKMSRVQI